MSSPDITTKFDSVVAKCSKILQFHSDSKYCDQALLLIGSSYAYTMQIDASRRELQDLMMHFPQSELLNQARLLYAKVDYYARSYDSCLSEANAVAQTAHDAGEHNVEIEALMLASQISIDRKDYDNAADICSKAVAIEGDDKLRALAAYQMGSAYIAAGNKQKAADAFGLVVNFHPLPDLRFKARLSYARLQADNGQYDPALQTLDDIRLEQTKPENIAMVHFERGRTYDLMGDTGKAFSVFRMMDTTYRGTPAAQKAFAERGRIYENRFHNFRIALDNYARAKNSGTTDISPMLDQKVNVYTHYFTLLSQFRTYDSIITPGPYKAYADSVDSLARLKFGLSGKDSTSKRKYEHGADTALAAGQPPAEQGDTTGGDVTRDKRRGGLRASIATTDPRAQRENNQTLADPDIRVGRTQMPDSLRNSKRGAKDTSRSKLDSARAARALARVITPDSARSLIIRARFELAGLFLLELDLPDSAKALYESIVTDSIRTRFIVSSYYALAQIALVQKDTAKADSLYTIIVTQFRHSEFARKIRRERGEAKEAVEEPDTSLVRYDAAARLLLAGDTVKAINAFQAIADTADTSSNVPRALYAIGWIYENFHAQNDSAALYYKILARKYPTTVYAERITPELAVKDDPKSLSKFVKVNEIAAVEKVTGKSGKGTGVKGKGGASSKQELPELDEDTKRIRSRSRDVTQDEKDDNTDDSDDNPDNSDNNNN